MNVAIRADSSSSVGGGHIGRCLAIADALHGRGHRVRFVSRPLPGNSIGIIESRGFPVDRLPSTGSDDPDKMVEVLRGGDIAWLLVDSYDIDRHWHERARQACDRLGVIDDRADRPYDCDLILDPGRTECGDYFGLVPSGCLVLTGPRFALLRAEFRQTARQPRTASRPAEGPMDVAVFYGSADNQRMTERTLDALDLAAERRFTAHVIVTPANLRHKEIMARCGTMSNVVVHQSVSDMAGFFHGMDFALGSGGGTMWERCCMGIPSAVVQVADNQAQAIRTAERAGAIVFLGLESEITPHMLARTMTAFAMDGRLRQRVRAAGTQLVDGWGAVRLAALMEPVDLRPAVPSDARLLWEWANDKEVRANAFFTEPIAWETHCSWLDAKLSSRSSRIYLGLEQGQPFGQVRFDKTGDDAEIDISVSGRHRGRGRGLPLLLRAVETYRREFPNVGLRALVKPDNAASQGVFLKAGFRLSQSSRPDALEFGLVPLR